MEKNGTKPSSEHQQEHKSVLALLQTRRFLPFFLTQFLGAFNDNVFKNALILLIAFQSQSLLHLNSDIAVNIAASLFILPFFLFSATAGQLSDKFEKSGLIRKIKFMEILIMGCASAAFLTHSGYVLLVVLFFMGAQSAFFGPVKYSIIPQHLQTEELIGGNAMVEMGTFLSILLGTITGGILAQMEKGAIWLTIVLLTIALAGYFCSRQIPKAQAADETLTIKLNPFVETWRVIQFAVNEEKPVFLSILGISWFWFLGVSYLTQIPNYTKLILHGAESVVTLLLAMFSIGIGCGSILCERLSGKRVEYGLVPIGSLGLSVFGIDLVFAYSIPPGDALVGILPFLEAPGSFRVLIDLILIGVFGGLYIVPLYAIMQSRSKAVFRSRIIGANNIINALFMVVASVMGAVLLGVMGVGIRTFFFILVVFNIAVAVYIYSLVPEFAMRCMVWLLTHLVYRIHHKNLAKIPTEGAAVLVCNHVSYVDALILGGVCRRPLKFLMDETYFKMPLINFFAKTARAIPIATHGRDRKSVVEAFDRIADALNQGELVCIFPEGRLTRDGEIGEFKKGVERIVARNPVPVVPSALRGLWGSFFSRKKRSGLKGFPWRFLARVEFRVADPLLPEEVSAEKLFRKVKALRGVMQ